ncbi:MAG: universal stress protein [Hyperthermus sp.]|nr:MAG: universal stress protein [Hyperthermus sp.]
MTYKCIVVGYDGSDASRIAVNRALELARTLKARMVIATVVPPPTVFLGELLVPEVIDTSSMEEEAHKRLKAIIAELGQGDVAVEEAVLMGDPADEIVGFAESNNCDLIVVGRRGKGGLERLILGSVSSKIVSISHNVDVLVVETGSKEERPGKPAGRT